MKLAFSFERRWPHACVALLIPLTLGLAATSSSAAAQAWPDKPIRVVVPFVPGSFTDAAARSVCAELAVQLGKPVIVENRGGAGSTVGTDTVAKSPADGSVFLFTDNSYAISPGLYPKLPYDPLKDLMEIATVAEAPAILTVRRDFPAQTLQDLIRVARANPGTVTFGSGGQGSSAHLGTELLQSLAGVQFIHVPFRGVAQALQETAAGRLDVTLTTYGTASGLLQSGRVRALAVAGKQRPTLLPDVPTFSEAGLPAFDMVYWFGFIAPSGTPPAIRNRLSSEIAKAVATERVRDFFAAQGARAVSSTPAAFSSRVRKETLMWREIIVKTGTKVD